MAVLNSEQCTFLEEIMVDKYKFISLSYNERKVLRIIIRKKKFSDKGFIYLLLCTYSLLAQLERYHYKFYRNRKNNIILDTTRNAFNIPLSVEGIDSHKLKLVNKSDITYIKQFKNDIVKKIFCKS